MVVISPSVQDEDTCTVVCYYSTTSDIFLSLRTENKDVIHSGSFEKSYFGAIFVCVRHFPNEFQIEDSASRVYLLLASHDKWRFS